MRRQDNWSVESFVLWHGRAVSLYHDGANSIVREQASKKWYSGDVPFHPKI
jgi:hypothetical protein